VITIPAPPWELLGGLLAGLAALLTALFGGMKVFAEIRDLRQQAYKTARDTAEVLSQQYTNGGSSLRDDIKRVLNISKNNAEAIMLIQEAQKRQDAEIGRFNRHTILLNERITSEMSMAASRLDDFSERVRRIEGEH
jgi:hypothetical protein